MTGAMSETVAAAAAEARVPAAGGEMSVASQEVVVRPSELEPVTA